MGWAIGIQMQPQPSKTPTLKPTHFSNLWARTPALGLVLCPDLDLDSSIVNRLRPGHRWVRPKSIQLTATCIQGPFFFFFWVVWQWLQLTNNSFASDGQFGGPPNLKLTGIGPLVHICGNQWTPSSPPQWIYMEPCNAWGWYHFHQTATDTAWIYSPLCKFSFKRFSRGITAHKVMRTQGSGVDLYYFLSLVGVDNFLPWSSGLGWVG